MTLAKSVLNETSTRTDLPADSTLALIALPGVAGSGTAVTLLTAGKANSYTTKFPLEYTAARRWAESNATPVGNPLPSNLATGRALASPIGTPSSVMLSRNTWTRALLLSATAKRRPSLLKETSRGR